MFFFIRLKVGLTDKLTLLRHVFVSLYAWILTPFLFERVHEITAGGIMFIFTLLLNYLFIIILGSKKERSIFISAAEFLWKIVLTIYKNIILYLILFLEGKIKKSKITYMIGLLYVDKRNLVNGTLLFLDPFLFLVRYRDNQNQNNNLSKIKMLWVTTIISLIAATIWALFIYFTNIRI